MFMKSEKTTITEMFAKLPKVVRSCKTMEQLIVAQKYTHLAYKMYPSRVLRVVGSQLWKGRWRKTLK